MSGLRNYRMCFMRNKELVLFMLKNEKYVAMEILRKEI